MSGICSDSTGNTKRARELVSLQIPWIIVVADPCHHLSSVAKNICNFPHFKITIGQLRRLNAYFTKSSYGQRHLRVLARIMGVTRGLEKVSKTRFLVIYWSGLALERNLDAIEQLFSNGTIVLSGKVSISRVI